MRCTSCDTSYPDGVTCCTKCGMEFHWEYKESIIQLAELNSNTPRRERRFDELVARHLAGVQESGWQLDGPTDWDSLSAAGRIKTSKESIAGGPPVHKFQTATVRLKRLHQDQTGRPQAPAPPYLGIMPDEAGQQPRTG